MAIAKGDTAPCVKDQSTLTAECFPFDVAALMQRCEGNERIQIPMGVVLREVLDDEEQRWLYDFLWKSAENTKAFDDLVKATDPDWQTNPENLELAKRIPLPLAFWSHPYSRLSSINEAPTRLLSWAQEVMTELQQESKGVKVDSMLAQVYFQGGRLEPHYDQDLSWGLGVSLGAMSVFHCLEDPPQQILLKSGDIIVGDFGKMLHGVQVLGDTTAPMWWFEVETLERARCNVLFRQALSEERQRELSEQIAVALYAKSLQELSEETRLSMGNLALVLRHAAEITPEALPPIEELADRFFGDTRS